MSTTEQAREDISSRGDIVGYREIADRAIYLQEQVKSGKIAGVTPKDEADLLHHLESIQVTAEGTIEQEQDKHNEFFAEHGRYGTMGLH